MKKLLVLLLLLPLWVFAADGDNCGVNRTGGGLGYTCRYLCENKVAADAGSSCRTLIDGPDFARMYHFAVVNDTGCSAYDVTVRTLIGTGNDTFDVCQFTNTTVADCYWFAEADGPLENQLLVAITTATDCTDLDVIAEFYTFK